MSDICERLREFPQFWKLEYDSRWNMGPDKEPLCIEAADEITRLRAELTSERAAHAQLQSRCFGSGPSCAEGVFDEVRTLRAELAEARVGEERYQCLLHNVGLINDLAKSWNPATNGKLIDYLNLKVATMVARTTKSSV